MARRLRLIDSGACYHLVTRGDGGKMIFDKKEDHLSFFHGLGRVCGSHGKRVHAWVLLGNHFHLMLETPDANLVSGMRLLLGSFGQAWNRNEVRRGHLFQGRYKSIPVTGERAAVSFQFWVMVAFAVAQNGRDRQADVNYLEKRVEDDCGSFSEVSMSALRGGCYLGDETFRNQLLGFVKKGSKLLIQNESYAMAPVKRYGEKEAERMVARGIEELGLANDARELTQARKRDSRKIALASVVKDHASASNEWLTQRLKLGHRRSVNRLVRQGSENSGTRTLCSELRKMSPCEAWPPALLTSKTSTPRSPLLRHLSHSSVLH